MSDFSKVLCFTAAAHHDVYPAIANSSHDGRIVLITGASKGIGRATAIAFAKAGARAIIIAARSDLDNVEADILAAATADTEVVKLRLDVTDQTAVIAAAAQIEQKFGHVDILINNAGYLSKWMSISESDALEWWKSWEVNIHGLYLVTRAFLPLVQRSPTRTIVNVSSIGAHSTYFGASAYQTAKLAVLRFTEFIALEYGGGENGVVVFSIHPGAVATELSGNMPDHMQARMVDTPELAAETLSWLTQQKQQWLNGRYVSVVWDMPELFARRDEIVEGDKLKVRMVL